MKAKDLRELSREELIAKLNELKEELFNLRMLKSVGRLEQPHRFKQIKKDIARILTILREDELGIRELPKEESK